MNPYPCRQFPLSDTQYSQMLRENVSQVSNYSAIRSNILPAFDYYNIGASSPSDTSGGEESMDAADTCLSKRKVSESSTDNPEKKKNKNHGPVSKSSSNLTINHSLNNKDLSSSNKRDDSNHKLSKQKMLDRKSININMKQQLQKTMVSYKSPLKYLYFLCNAFLLLKLLEMRVTSNF